MRELEVMERLAACRAAGGRIVFTNGVFDVLHLGHATYLKAARELGEFLIVGVNSDDSVRRLGKGPERPIHKCADRMALLEHLQSVDATLEFGEDTPLELIRKIEPDVLVKGGDYNPDQADPTAKDYIVGREIVMQQKGEVVAIPLVQGHSTTGILRRSRMDKNS